MKLGETTRPTRRLNELMIQNIRYHDRICDLERALQTIARKKKMDATAAASMRAIAIATLCPVTSTDNCGGK